VQFANGIVGATFTTSTLVVGTHSITATYGGDDGHTGSTSLALSETVMAPLPPPLPPPVITPTNPSPPVGTPPGTPANPGSGQAARLTVANDLTHSAQYYGDFVTAAYQKCLGRTPDSMGLAYWVNQMQNGLSDERLEAGFIGSAEYIQDHGGTGPNWVEGLYENLLGRLPAASEVAYWVNNLNNGMSPADIAYGFAASQERETQRVAADYQQYLGRSAISVELPYWVNAFLQGANNEQVIAGFVASQEYFQAHGSDITQWLNGTFQATLDRTPNATETQYWLSQLQ